MTKYKVGRIDMTRPNGDVWTFSEHCLSPQKSSADFEVNSYDWWHYKLYEEINAGIKKAEDKLIAIGDEEV